MNKQLGLLMIMSFALLATGAFGMTGGYKVTEEDLNRALASETSMSSDIYPILAGVNSALSQGHWVTVTNNDGEQIKRFNMKNVATLKEYKLQSASPRQKALFEEMIYKSENRAYTIAESDYAENQRGTDTIW